MIPPRKNQTLTPWVDLCLCLLGTFCYGLAIACFTAPNRIAPGGASGIAILLHYVTGFQMGLFVFIFNIPFLLWILFRKTFPLSFILRTTLATATLWLMTDYVVVKIPPYQGNPLLAAIFGGALMGIGLGLVHLARTNTGGISLLGLLLQKAYPQFRIGSLMIMLNMIVVLLSGLIYQNIESMFYALLAVYLSGVFMDKLVDHMLTNTCMIIVSEATDAVCNIITRAGHGVTVLQGQGGYLGGRQRVLLCAAKKRDCEKIQKQVKMADELALIIVTPASKIEGKGFTHLI